MPTPLLVLVWLLLGAVLAAQEPRWGAADWSSEPVDPHLWPAPSPASTSAASDGQRIVQQLLRLLHARQHPPPEQCSQTRLLVLQMRVTGLEGVGSLLKHVVYGLAHAVHTNRTLVWGAALPYFFEKTADMWQHDGVTSLDGMQLHCRGETDPYAGPFSCLFQRLSSCTPADATASELRVFSADPFNPQSRLLLTDFGQTARNSITWSTPPAGLLAAGAQRAGAAGVSLSPHLWVGAVATYAFRLQPAIAQQFHTHFAEVHQPATKGVRWAIHVRHGDVKARRATFAHKLVWPFEAYFAAARDLSHEWQQAPQEIYLASDSDAIHTAPMQWSHWAAGLPAPETPPDVFSPPRVQRHSAWFDHAATPSILIDPVQCTPPCFA